jgi:hypothetical protein
MICTEREKMDKEISLSVINRAAELYAKLVKGTQAEESELISDLTNSIYPKDEPPFVISEQYPLPLHLLSPRIRIVLEENVLDSGRLWAFLSSKENVIRMITASEIGRPAAEAMSYRLEAFYPGKPRDFTQLVQFKQIIGYMIKIIMEMFGYAVEQKRVKNSSHYNPDTLKDLKYFTTASRYRKMSLSDIQKLVSKIEDAEERSIFAHITNLILTGETQYQKQYALDGLTLPNAR